MLIYSPALFPKFYAVIAIFRFAGPARGLERKTSVGHTVAALPVLAFVAA